MLRRWRHARSVQTDHVLRVAQALPTFGSTQANSEKALARAQNELSIAEQYGENSLVAFAHFIASFAYTQKGEFAKAIEQAEISVDEAPTLADKVWARTFLGFALCRGGHSDAAGLLASLVPIYDALKVVLGQVFINAWLGEAYWRFGATRSRQGDAGKWPRTRQPRRHEILCALHASPSG